MGLTSEEHRREAERLLALDSDGLELEAVALALRIGDTSESAMRDLLEIDREFIRMLDGRYSQGDLATEGPMEGPHVEHLGT